MPTNALQFNQFLPLLRHNIMNVQNVYGTSPQLYILRNKFEGK